MVPFHFIQTWYQVIQEQVKKKGDWIQNTSLEVTLWTLILMAALQCRFCMSIDSQWSLWSLSHNMFWFTESEAEERLIMWAASTLCCSWKSWCNWGGIWTKIGVQDPVLRQLCFSLRPRKSLQRSSKPGSGRTLILAWALASGSSVLCWTIWRTFLLRLGVHRIV